MIEQNKQINIPGFTLSRQNKNLDKELVDCFSLLLHKGMFILHENVKNLEEKIAYLCNLGHGIGVASGSDALYLSLMAWEIGPGDEVITTPFTFYATAGSISRAGAKPVFVDINPQTWNIAAELIEEKVTPDTKAILPVHLYGCPAEMDEILEVAEKYNLKVIEDAAQALGAKYKGQMVGSLGDVGCFSFFPTKNLGAFGDAGMVVTGDLHLAERIKLLRVHGAKVKYYHEIPGCNSRLDELQAAILNLKINYFEQWTNRRREIASLYNALFIEHINAGRLCLKLPQEPDYAYHVYHQYTIQTDSRDELQDYLKKHGVGSAVYYPLPLHLQKVFSSLGYLQGDFPLTEAACSEVLSLPMFPELADEEAANVVDAVVNFFSR